MKKKTLFRSLAAALTLTLMLVTIPAVPVMAVVSPIQTITVNPNTGEVGDSFDVTGDCSSTSLEIYVFFSSQNVEEGDIIGTDVTAYEWLYSTNYNGLYNGYRALDLEVPAVLTGESGTYISVLIVQPVMFSVQLGQKLLLL